MSSTHGGSLEGVVSGIVTLLKVELPDYLSEENDKITANFSGPPMPDDLIGFTDDVVPSRHNKNTIRVFTDGETEDIPMQGSINEDAYYSCNVGVVWDFSCSLEQMGVWKRTMYNAVKRAILGKWKHYLGQASVYHVKVDADLRSASPRQQGTKSSNVFTALEAAKSSNDENMTAIVRVKYVFSEDVSH